MGCQRRCGKKSGQPAIGRGLSKEVKQRLGQGVNNVADAWQPRFKREAKRQLEEDKAVLLEILRKTPERKAEIDWQTIDKSWQDYFAVAGPLRWRKAFVPLIQGVITDTGGTWEPFFTQVAVGMSFGVENIFATQSYNDYVIPFAQPIMESTDLDCRSILQKAMHEGWTIPDMEKALGTLFENYMERGGLTDEEMQWFADRLPRYRLENISRTETLRASNFGSWQMFNGWGAPFKEWYGTPDNRIRPDHLDAMTRYTVGGNPGPIPISESFIVGGVRMMFPGDGPAEQVCQCRCSVMPYNPKWQTL